MPAVAFRLPPRDIALMTAGGECPQEYSARIDRPISNIDLDEVFLDLGSANCQAGDLVKFVAFRDRSWKEVMEERHARVISKRMVDGRMKVKAFWVSDLLKVPEEILAPEKPRDLGKLSIKEEFKGDFTVRDAKDNVIERVNTRPEAEAYIARLEPKPPVSPSIGTATAERKVIAEEQPKPESVKKAEKPKAPAPPSP